METECSSTVDVILLQHFPMYTQCTCAMCAFLYVLCHMGGRTQTVLYLLCQECHLYLWVKVFSSRVFEEALCMQRRETETNEVTHFPPALVTMEARQI